MPRAAPVARVISDQVARATLAMTGLGLPRRIARRVMCDQLAKLSRSQAERGCPADLGGPVRLAGRPRFFSFRSHQAYVLLLVVPPLHEANRPPPAWEHQAD